MEEKILDFIMDYAAENSTVPFQVIEEEFNIMMDDGLRATGYFKLQLRSAAG